MIKPWDLVLHPLGWPCNISNVTYREIPGTMAPDSSACVRPTPSSLVFMLRWTQFSAVCLLSDLNSCTFPLTTGSGESGGPGLLGSRWWVSRTQHVAWGRPLRSHYDRVLVAMSYQRLLEVYSVSACPLSQHLAESLFQEGLL